MTAFIDHVEVVLPEGKHYVVVLGSGAGAHVLVARYLSPLLIAQFLADHLGFERLRLPRAHPYFGPGATHDVRSLLEHEGIDAVYGERDEAVKATLDTMERALRGSADSGELRQRLERWRAGDGQTL